MNSTWARKLVLGVLVAVGLFGAWAFRYEVIECAGMDVCTRMDRWTHAIERVHVPYR